jgi:MFS family permease
MKRARPIRDYLLLANLDPVIRFLIIGDVIYYAGAGLLGPIFALFVADFVGGPSAEVAGIAAAVYLLTKSIAQIPAGILVDKICGDKDDFWFMFGGLVVASLMPLCYLFVSTPIQLYLVQFVLGLALAFNFPSFMALFTKYLTDNKEATAWSMYFTLTDLAMAGAAALGGYLAVTLGFEAVIIAVSSIGFVGALLLLPIRKHLRAENC